MHGTWRWGLTAALAGLVVVAAVFAIRLAGLALHGPEQRDAALAPWMTPRYVAMSWDVPGPVLIEALDLAPEERGRRATLERLAEARGEPVEALIARLAEAIAAHRKGLPGD